MLINTLWCWFNENKITNSTGRHTSINHNAATIVFNNHHSLATHGAVSLFRIRKTCFPRYKSELPGNITDLSASSIRLILLTADMSGYFLTERLLQPSFFRILHTVSSWRALLNLCLISLQFGKLLFFLNCLQNASHALVVYQSGVLNHRYQMNCDF